VGFVPWEMKASNNFLNNYLLSSKVREGAPLLEGAPLGMRRRDERLRKRCEVLGLHKGEGKAWDPCLR
jgi:hypothetical protein